jgi:hypothetical protein
MGRASKGNSYNSGRAGAYWQIWIAINEELKKYQTAADSLRMLVTDSSRPP